MSDWNYVSGTPFFRRAMDEGLIVQTGLAALPEMARSEPGADGSEPQPAVPWAGALWHERLPFISYPYEWSFGMLQDAALLHLDLLERALADDVSMKDGTAYNVQWRGATPVFIDVASFEPLSPGQPWAGYRQFCQTFLYPLFLQAYKHVDFQPWLRGRLDGITPEEFRNLMSFRDRFRPGVFTHVILHAWLQSRKTFDEVDTARALPKAGFAKELIRNNARGLRRLVSRLNWTPPASAWSGYIGDNTYSQRDRDRKLEFVRRVVAQRARGLTWDLGCNTGEYSRIAAENSDLVVAADADPQSVERLYQSLRTGQASLRGRILPLVVSVSDPSGGLGWRGAERKPFEVRGHPELILCLALVHHLVISQGIPLPELVRWLTALAPELIIEFVDKSDPMVKRLLRGRRDNYTDYSADVLRECLSESMEIVQTEALECGTRTLFHAARERA